MKRQQTEQLAMDGGIPVREAPIPVAMGGACIGEEEKRAVVEVLESQSLFRYYGPRLLEKTRTFEEEFAEAMSCSHALAVSSGTAALRCALKSLDIGTGDEVLVPDYSFLACATAVLISGATPVFLECDESLLLDPADLERKLSSHTRGLLVVHTNGASADLTSILDFAKKHGLAVIEDCAQACGTTFRGQPVGSFGHLGTFSLQFQKVITSGEGGAVTTSDNKLHARAVYYHDLGFQRPGRDGEPIVGENMRMSELAAAVALEQLRKLPDFLATMRRHHARLRSAVDVLPGLATRKVPDPEGDQGSSLVLRLRDAQVARFFRHALRAENIPCDGCHAKQCSNYPVIAAALPGAKSASPKTREILACSVAIPISPALSDEDVDDIEYAVRKVARHINAPAL